MSKKIDVGILGATGIVGQTFVSQLESHPWFNLTWLGASQRSEGKRYVDAATWRLEKARPSAVEKMMIDSVKPGRAPRVLFSALDSSVAGDVEVEFAKAGHVVISNASNHRMEPDVPLLVPEVNPDHLQLLSEQGKKRMWPGRIVTNPNCSTIVLVMALGPLRQFQPHSLSVTTLQAVSGAGFPGISSLEIVGNVVPFIDGEEEKIETETKKILGSYKDGSIEPHPVTVSANTTRVGVVDGHTEVVSIGFEKTPKLDDLREALESFTGIPQLKDLPSAPTNPIVYLEEPDRPQPRLDVGRENGMAVSVGRLRPCSVFDYKFVVLGHNTVRGAAGAALLNAELMHAQGMLA